MGVDAVIKNANVLTLEQDHLAEAERPRAVAIDAGRIRAVGSNAQIEALAAEDTRVLDARGRTVMPGFIDCHVHFTQTGLGSLGPQVYGVTSKEAVLALIAEEVSERRPGEPLLVHGCCFHDLDSVLSCSDLDRVAPRNAVMVADLGAHACAVSSRAWERIALPAGTPGVDTDGAGRRAGVLRGVANTRARYAYYSEIVTDDMRVAALHRASRMALEVGITTVHALDGGSPDGRGWLPERDIVVLLDERGRLPVHTVVYFQSIHVEVARDLGLPRIGGCVWVDGTYFERTAGLAEPYADDPGNCGCLYFEQAELDAFVWEAHRAGLQVSMHAIGDAAIEQLLLALERALRREPRGDHRHRIEHFSLPTGAQIERMASLGVVASMQPNFAIHPPLDESGHRTGAGLERLLGTPRFGRRHPYRRLLDAGVLVCGGSDADPAPMGPLIGVERLVSHPESIRRLSAHEALRLYTANAARAAFEEADRGTVSVGKVADLVVLAQDPTTAPAASLSQIGIDLTMVAGRIAHERVGGIPFDV